MTRAWIRMIATSTDRGNMVLATSLATALASADCLTLTGVKATAGSADDAPEVAAAGSAEAAPADLPAAGSVDPDAGFLNRQTPFDSEEGGCAAPSGWIPASAF